MSLWFRKNANEDVGVRSVGQLPRNAFFEFNRIGLLPTFQRLPGDGYLFLERLDLVVDVAHVLDVGCQRSHALLDSSSVELVLVRQPRVSHGLQLDSSDTLPGLPLLENPIDALRNEHESVPVRRVGP